MKPEQFIREKGLKKAREVVEGAPEGATHYGLRQYRQWEGRILKTFTDESWRSTAVFGGNLRFIEDDCLCIQDLKRLVESLDLVKKLGGRSGAIREYFEYVHSGKSELDIRPNELARVIRDHESIYGGGDE
ncbi:hypothetical protein AXE56_RS05555 [Acinetobacter baumannii]|uniref:hypothetical protein n=1 Tax=Acinetobacter TaxID=469 RepID=UPI000277BEA7|nr:MULTISPECIES: hypothetical protein [Acinetobacter]AYX96068.1 hypothetical protein EGY13_06725 [Acinetobacter sp. FDAARGOS_493]EHU1249311.1 hypothetical protein [Acinetobacter baumannii]EHU1270305.1 hypothetical protein [Acinetobacter baumannii]EHU1277681.1 hypothetical protein [Acinetobacter baumannii]EHU1302704.1 hypothetical protein [Acinetobacter baumannii]